MKLILLFCLFFGIFALTLSSTVRDIEYKHPDYPGKCYINKDIILDPGQTHETGHCSFIKCNENSIGTNISSHPAGCKKN